MGKRLTPSEFETATQGLSIADRPAAMARAVLVDGQSQADCARAMRVSRNAVHLAVNRVWEAHQAVPTGFERVTAILPKHQASVVRSWHERAPFKAEPAR